MSVRFALLIASLAASLPAAAGEEEADVSPPSVAVIMDFEDRYSPVFLSELEHELESILRPCALNLQWRILDESTPRESFTNLVVARFKGNCRNDVAPEPASGATTLGFTHISEGEILPFSEVDCDRLRRFVLPEAAREERPHRDRLLGRASARVLAHELYHILAHTKQHARRGLAKAVLTAQELVEGAMEFEPSQAHSIRRALTPQPLLIRQASARK